MMTLGMGLKELSRLATGLVLVGLGVILLWAVTILAAQT
jgi:hypothetical protein